MANYGGAGDAYVDVGVANAHALFPFSAHKAASVYSFGLSIRFCANHENDSTSVTAKLNVLATVPMHVGQLANGGTPSVLVGFITEDKYIEAVYVATPNGLFNYFQIVSAITTSNIVYGAVTSDKITSLSVSKLADGVIDIKSGDDEWTQSASIIEYKDVGGGIVKRLLITTNVVAIYADSSSSGNNAALKPDGCEVEGYVGTTFTPKCKLTGRGIDYPAGAAIAPGESNMVGIREAEFSDTITWSGSGTQWVSSSDFLLSGMPVQEIISASVTWVSGGLNYSSPASIKIEDNGSGVAKASKILITSPDSTTPTAACKLYIKYSAENLD